MAGEQSPDLRIVEGDGEGGLAIWEMERAKQARAAGEAFADEVEAEWRKLQGEVDTDRPIVFTFDVGLIYGGNPYETRSVELPGDIAQAVERANQIALELEGGASHRIMVNDKVELPDGRVISLDDLRVMAAPIESPAGESEG